MGVKAALFWHLNVACGCLSGMVLVRTELGQLVMVPQQALAQVQAQAQAQAQAQVQAQAQNSISPRPGTPTSGASFRVTTPQVRAPQRPHTPGRKGKALPRSHMHSWDLSQVIQHKDLRVRPLTETLQHDVDVHTQEQISVS